MKTKHGRTRKIGANLNGVKTKARMKHVKVRAAITVSPTKRLLLLPHSTVFSQQYRVQTHTGVLSRLHEFVSPVTGTVLCFSLHHSVVLLERLDGNMTRTDQSRQSVATYQFSAVPWNSYFVLWL